MAKRTGADLVPVGDVWADDSELTVSPLRRYDWVTLAEKAMGKPGKWLLVDENGSPSTVSNINNGLIAGLKRIAEQRSMIFTSRASETRNVSDPSKPRRAKVWLMATPVPATRGRRKASR